MTFVLAANQRSDVVLVCGQVVHEGLDQVVCGEVEHQAEGDGDGQRWESLLKDGQQQQGQTQALEHRPTFTNTHTLR